MFIVSHLATAEVRNFSPHVVPFMVILLIILCGGKNTISMNDTGHIRKYTDLQFFAVFFPLNILYFLCVQYLSVES